MEKRRTLSPATLKWRYLMTIMGHTLSDMRGIHWRGGQCQTLEYDPAVLQEILSIRLYTMIVRGPGPGTSTRATWICANLPLLPIKSYSALDHTQLECIQMMEGMIPCTWAQISDLARERSPYANLKFAGYDRIRSGAILSLWTIQRIIGNGKSRWLFLRLAWIYQI